MTIIPADMAVSTATGTNRSRLTRWVPVVFLVATGIGVVLRLGLAGMALPIPFDHLLHAHSHALYFGWAALTILAAAASTLRVRRWAWLGLALTPVMTAAFLVQGYGPLSIAASTLVMVAWYGAIAAWWGERDRRFGASFLYVIVASGGVWVLAVLQATGTGGDLASDLAIHAFLSTFAWSLVLGSVALAMERGWVPQSTGRTITVGMAAVAWLLFPLGVAGGPEVPVLGWMARAAAFAVALPTAVWIRALWLSPARLRLPAVWLGVAVAGLVAVAVEGTSLLGVVGRPGVVIYLHALLLGYVSTLLILYLAEEDGAGPPPTVHHLGVAVMLAGMAAPILGSGLSVPAAWTAALGAGLVWGAAWMWAPPLWRTR
ncbi:MAG: hypothetical protein ACLFWM_13900 [Actinomycetota bacterium]